MLVEPQDGQEWSSCKQGREKEFTWRKREGHTGSRRRKSQVASHIQGSKEASVKSQPCKRWDLLLTSPQGHFTSLSWEISGHLHIRRARLSKQYQCENPMTFSRGSLGKSWACFQSRNHFLHVPHFSLNLHAEVHRTSCNKTSMRNSHKNSANTHLIDSNLRTGMYLRDSLIQPVPHPHLADKRIKPRR